VLIPETVKELERVRFPHRKSISSQLISVQHNCYSLKSNVEFTLQLEVSGIVMATTGIILTGTGLILDNYQKYKNNDSARRFERALKEFCQNSSGNHTLSK
jgi:hypothetical protein